ncbi:MAG TPA: RNA polymerase subunit sigma-24 [Ruminococcus sp.]|nr:RNA polymerase subunit sigma-24 [Ruminococcus sp.]
MDYEQMAAVYDRMKNTVYRTALAYCRNVQDAEDITHDVFLARFEHEAPFPDDEAEKAWLLRVTVNRCKNLLKSFRRRFTVPLEDAGEVCVTDSEHQVWDAVNALPEKYRLVIHLYYYEGYSVAEIGTITGRSETAVQTQLYRARKLLKNKLGEELEL